MATTTYEWQELLDRLKAKYPCEKLEENFKDIIEFSVSLFKRLSNDMSITVFSADDKTWIKKCCFEMCDRIYNLGIIGGVKSYSENGYQFTLGDSTDVSQSLKNEIIPRVGYAK
ncbi:MAG: hypothetical protein RR533_02725 [Carnobacterium sp.]